MGFKYPSPESNWQKVIPLEQAIEAENPEEIEDEIDLEELFYPPPTNEVTLPVPDQLTDSTPP